MDPQLKSTLKESRIHSGHLQPFGAYHMEYGPGEHVLDCHWHEESEIFLVLEGEVLFQLDEEHFPVRAGEAVFIDGGDIHAGHALGGAGCKFFALVFGAGLLTSAQYDIIQDQVILPFQERRVTFPRLIQPSGSAGQELLKHIQAMMTACTVKPPGYEAAVKGRLLLMLQELAVSGMACDRSLNRSGSAVKLERLKKVILHIQQHYDRPIRLQELADLIPMSEGQFCRFFKSMTGQTPVDYINSYRIRQAAEMLRVEDKKISDIALEVGFDNISYFIRVFRKIMKCPPSAFRKGISP
ncbi:AraC family transcriptional regulator [Paenibacillus sp. J22TS3]|uniref:helix-turn-helix transcriptional regulator n=1 Tax=Paenibacillus sp. J22TS3 TaxID=2807192 RepID=UPI001B2F7925|nr:AraC family transcriptional regulator [Paenibacillus sp. J22TS3]GIP23903.1 AraC family transcriptional regulator [Paenibacillus sp. J22TS3]